MSPATVHSTPNPVPSQPLRAQMGRTQDLNLRAQSFLVVPGGTQTDSHPQLTGLLGSSV